MKFFYGPNGRGGNPFSSNSIAAGNGWSTASVLNPPQADPNVCRAGETPLQCEYRVSRPSVALIMLGTNDWHDQTCQNQGPAACFTIEALGSIVEQVKDWDSLPVLATIIPGNPTMVPASRNAWFDEMNTRIKALAQEQKVTLADLNAEFKAAGSLPALFADDVHPNDAGYQAMAQGWFKAITRARSAAASSSPRFGFAPRP
jgi:lysophospholipase L1-like esterase